MILGHNYRHKAGGEKAIVFKCVYVTDVSKLGCCAPAVAVLRWPGGAETYIERDNWSLYEEFVEPRHEFFNAYKDRLGASYYTGAFPTRNYADLSNGNSASRYGVLELIHHSDTKVESVFHLVKKEK